MIYSFVHPGSGLGNSLHRIIAGKVLALDKGYDYSAIGRENFKGKSFMNLDMGRPNDLLSTTEYPEGKIRVCRLESQPILPPLWEEKTNYYNPEFNFIKDNTIIDGEFQSEQYFSHRMKEIDEWLKVEPINIPTDVCVIGFRGGEFKVFPELFLPIEYWNKGIEKMLEINPNMKFEVHTDDAPLAGQFFPGFKVIHDIGINWRSMRYAKYAIIANSSFYILPRLLRQEKYTNWDMELVDDGAVTIAPRYWARHNTKEWSRPDNFYRAFQYI